MDILPRKPMLEKILKKKGILNNSERKINSIFIGNYENMFKQNIEKIKIGKMLLIIFTVHLDRNIYLVMKNI